MFKLLRFLKPYLGQVILLALIIATQTWTTLQLPALMSKIVNGGIIPSDTNYIWYIGLHMLCSALVSAFCALLAAFLSSKISMSFARDLRNSVFEKILSFTVSDINSFSTASLITRTTNDISQVQQAASMMLNMLVRAPMMAVVAIIQAFRTAADMTWIIALAVAVTIFLVALILGSVMPKFKIFQTLLDKITLLTRENLTGIRVIRAFNNDKFEQKKFAAANDELTRTILFINKIMSLENPLILLVFNGVTVLCIWIGISHIEANFDYVGNMIAFMQYALQVLMAFLVLTILFVMLPRANVSATRINEVLLKKSEINWKESTAGAPSRTPSIKFEHVSFAYPDAKEKILSDISFSAKSGETVAFIGSTGSGKSTLINLVPRFYEATSGKILINDLDIKDYSKNDLISMIGYVPQRGVLFSGTIAENIKFGAPKISDEKMKKAAEIAQAKNFIEKFEKKYNHHIAQGGSNVSGGQRQRLSIARAIAKDPEIYVFDDSFSALDMKTDQNLQKALKEVTKNSIVLIVAQRINTIKNADKIIVLEKGKIAGKGNHAELLSSCKTYQKIVESQLSEDEFKKELKLAKEVKNA